MWTNLLFPPRTNRLSVRDATDDDCPTIATVELAAAREAYGAFVPVERLDDVSATDNAAAWRQAVSNDAIPDARTIVAEQRGEVVAVAHAGRTSARDGFGGALHALFVHPNAQRRGIGGKLFDDTLAWFSDQGVSAAFVEVYARNPFRQFYESKGGKVISKFGVSAYGQTIETVAYGWRGL
jgi:GNAT superfamily N-acetyltransferase